MDTTRCRRCAPEKRRHAHTAAARLVCVPYARCVVCSWEPPAGFTPTAAAAAPAVSDWTSAVDPGSGNTYYYNAVTGETRWDPPDGFDDGGDDDGGDAESKGAESGGESAAASKSKRCVFTAAVRQGPGRGWAPRVGHAAPVHWFLTPSCNCAASRSADGAAWPSPRLPRRRSSSP